MSKERYAIIGLLLSLTVLALWTKRLNDQLNMYYNPFFAFEIEHARDLVITKWRSTGKVFSYGYDLNEDLADDSLIQLGAVGSSATIWVDQDYNGVYDLEYVINDQGRCIAQYRDPHQDGYFESYTFLTPDSAFTFIDNNEDGRFTEDEIRSREPARE